MDNTTPTFFIVLTLVNVLFTTWLAFRRTAAQNVLDDSTASVNYRKIVIELQADVEALKKENKELKKIIENSHLDIGIAVELNGTPVLTSWKWKAIEKDK